MLLQFRAGLLLHPHFYSFQDFEFPGGFPSEFSACNPGIDAVNLLLLGGDIENFADNRLEISLHLRDVEIAVVGKTDSPKTFGNGRRRALLKSGPCSVKGKLTMVMSVIIHGKTKLDNYS